MGRFDDDKPQKSAPFESAKAPPAQAPVADTPLLTVLEKILKCKTREDFGAVAKLAQGLDERDKSIARWAYSYHLFQMKSELRRAAP